MDQSEQLEAFRQTLAFVEDQGEDIETLETRTADIVDAVEWALYDSPETSAQTWLEIVAEGTQKLLEALGVIAEPSFEGTSTQESEYALSKLCLWRSEMGTVVRRWLFGWWTLDGSEQSVWQLIVLQAESGIRLLRFVWSLLWLFSFAWLGSDLRHGCQHADPNAPRPLPVDPDETPAEAPPPEVVIPASAPGPCKGLDELAAFIEVDLTTVCPDDTISAHQTRLEFAGWDADTRWDLARCYLKDGDFSRAIAAYKEILDKRPEYHEARKELTYCYAAQGQWDQAETQIKYLSRFERYQPVGQAMLDCIVAMRNQSEHETTGTDTHSSES